MPFRDLRSSRSGDEGEPPPLERGLDGPGGEPRDSVGNAADLDDGGCSPERFRHAIGHLPTGVTVVTAAHDGTWFGMTASAVASVSLEPPMLLVCINRRSPTHDAVQASRRFGVNVLSAGQTDLAERFATSRDDKFDGVAAWECRGRVPLLAGALAHVECRVVDEARGGTHSVFLARARMARAEHGSPLVHFRGSFRRLESERHPPPTEHDEVPDRDPSGDRDRHESHESRPGGR